MNHIHMPSSFILLLALLAVCTHCTELAQLREDVVVAVDSVDSVDSGAELTNDVSPEPVCPDSLKCDPWEECKNGECVALPCGYGKGIRLRGCTRRRLL